MRGEPPSPAGRARLLGLLGGECAPHRTVGAGVGDAATDPGVEGAIRVVGWTVIHASLVGEYLDKRARPAQAARALLVPEVVDGPFE